jgi:hypothetical protein
MFASLCISFDNPPRSEAAFSSTWGYGKGWLTRLPQSTHSAVVPGCSDTSL